MSPFHGPDVRWGWWCCWWGRGGRTPPSTSPSRLERNWTEINLVFVLFFFKGQCHKIFDHYFFCLKDSTWAPYEHRQKQFCKLSFSQRSSIAKFENRESALSTPTRTIFLDTEVFLFLNYCYWVCKHTQVLFFLFFPLKSVRSLQSFPKVSAYIVFVMSA